MTFKHKLSARLARLKYLVAGAALMAATVAACELPLATTSGGDTATRLVVFPPTLTIYPSQTTELMAVGFTASGDTGTIDVSWSVSGGSIISTDTKGGRHYGKYKAGSDTGNYKVVAKGKSGTLADTATVAVIPTPVASVTVTPAVVSLLVGASVQLAATTKDSVGNVLSGRIVSWASSAPAVATVSSSGLVTGAGVGSATITATSEEQSGTSVVTVTSVAAPVASVSVAPTSANLQVGQSVQLTATPRDASGNALGGRTVTWSSSNSSAAGVSGSGLVTGAGAGSATITATSEGQSGTAAITVTTPPPPAPVASVDVSPASASLDVGKTVQLTATPKDANGNPLSGRTVTWSSSNTTVATVSSSGLVTGQVAGSATITATSEGQTGAATVTVTASSPPVNTVPPAISGPTQQGAVVTVSTGTWSGSTPMTYAYQWKRCDVLGAGCAAITGATSLSYVLTAAEVGATVRADVTATNAVASATATSSPTGVITSSTGYGGALPPPLAPSTGTAYYVSLTGSDANPGTLTAPWQTVQKAMNALRPGEKAYIRAGTYRTGGTFGTTDDRWVWTANCTASAPCSILAYPGERPVLHGQVRFEGSYLRLSGVVIEGPLSRDVTSPTERRAMQVEITAGAHHIEFSRNEVRYNDYHAGIYLSTCHDIQLLGNHIHDNGRFTLDADPLTGSNTWNVDHGIYWHDTNGGGNVFANNLVEHNRGSGLHLYPDSHDVIVTQNTFVNNGKEGVLISTSSDRNIVINNVAAFNELQDQIRVQSGAANLIQNNITFSPNSSWSGIENTAGATVKDNLVADPLFVNRLGHDFHLLAGSPALDRALAAYSMTADFENATRPRGVAADQGAFER